MSRGIFNNPFTVKSFDPNGKVTAGPAKRDLPLFPVVVNESGHLLVELPGR
jgi:Rieske Fe-S protein